MKKITQDSDILRILTQKPQIKELIDEIYTQEKRYEKRSTNKDDYVASKNLVFDLSKVNMLDTVLEERLADSH
jgi:TusA-related sulfurtransferase